jgi:2-hydroxychromene-2-carboxylate isomerase
MSAEPVDFSFDFTCPYAYIASTRLPTFRRESGRTIRFNPVLLGGLFKALNQPQNMSTTLSPAKAENNRKELVRWASWYGVELRTPLRHPNRSVLALRTLLACPEPAWSAVIASFYTAYWVACEDIADPGVLSRRLDQLGLDGSAILQVAESQVIKDELRRRTAEASALGIFGVPTLNVDGQLFWGQDRMEMAAAAAKGWRADPEILRDFGFNQSSNEAKK